MFVIVPSGGHHGVVLLGSAGLARRGRGGSQLSVRQRLLLGQLPTGDDPGAQLGERDALVRVGREDAGQRVVQFIRHGQDGLEEVPAARVGAVGRVLGRRLLPRVAPAGQVDEDHAQAPDVVGGAVVKGPPGGGIQAF